MKIKIVEYLICIFGALFVLNWFGLWFVFSSFGEIPFKISAILFVILGIINYILVCILVKGQEKDENKKQDN